MALAVLVLRGAALRRGMGQTIFRDEATGRLRALPSSPRRVAEWLVLRYPQAVRGIAKHIHQWRGWVAD